jgi:hypothetical protein
MFEIPSRFTIWGRLGTFLREIKLRRGSGPKGYSPSGSLAGESAVPVAALSSVVTAV